MPPIDGYNQHNSVRDSTNDELEDIHWNPFDDSADSKPFTSGRAPSRSHSGQRSVTRRRGESESAGSSSTFTGSATISSPHSRSRTVDDETSGHHDRHPLSSRSSSSLRHDAGSSTRPRLARALSSWASETGKTDELDEADDGGSSAPTSKNGESQRLVLVHEVSCVAPPMKGRLFTQGCFLYPGYA